MSTQATLERIVIDRLQADAPSRAPDRLLRSTLDRVADTPQERVLWRPQNRRATRQREAGRNPTRARFAALMLAFLVLGVVGVAFLFRPAGVVGPETETTPPRPTSTSPRETPSLPPRADSQPVGVGPLAAGRYHVDVQVYGYRAVDFDNTDARLAGGAARLSFRLPEGWHGDGRSVYKEGNSAPATIRLAPSTVARVYRDPCDPTPPIVESSLVRTVDGLAETLSKRWLGAPETRPTTTEPVALTLDGFDSRYIELTAPPALDIAACDDGVYAFWSDTDGTDRAADGSGQLDRLWIVNVGGSGRTPAADGSHALDPAERVFVVTASSLPGTTAEDLAELQSVIDSIEIGFDDRLQSGIRPLDAGPQRVQQDTWSALRGPLSGFIELRVPDGWATDDSGRVFKGGPGMPVGIGVQVGTIKNVYADPCRWKGGLSDADMGHGPDHPAYAAMAQALLGDGAAAEVSDLSGREGLALTMHTPASIEDCDDGEFRRWIAAPGAPAFVHRPGQVDLVWLLDPDREMVVVHAWYFPDTSAADQALLLDIVESATYSLP
jgi:hypothetical protein